MRVISALALTGAILGPLAGCAGLPSQPPPGDPATCRAAFQSYDQAARLFPPRSVSSDWDGDSTQDAAVSRATSRILQGACLTTSRELDGLEMIAATLGPRQPVNSGAAIPPTAVHVGILSGFENAGRAIAFFQSQGYRTRTMGAEKLGRRLYIGPVTSQGALDQAITLAAQAGFPSAYPSDLFKFWNY